MIIENCFITRGKTLCMCSEDPPDTKWNKVIIDGIMYDPIIAYDLKGAFAIGVEKDVKGCSVEFVFQ